MVGCFGTNFLSSATYMGEKPLLLHDTYCRKKIPKSTIGINPIFGIHLVSCYSSYRV